MRIVGRNFLLEIDVFHFQLLILGSICYFSRGFTTSGQIQSNSCRCWWILISFFLVSFFFLFLRSNKREIVLEARRTKACNGCLQFLLFECYLELEVLIIQITGGSSGRRMKGSMPLEISVLYGYPAVKLSFNQAYSLFLVRRLGRNPCALGNKMHLHLQNIRGLGAGKQVEWK